uniref:Uncharacterized protein n=1 Tax=Arundo donax TaxID=35708 RepID=A0A0A9BIJ0_ARUDO
MLITGKASSKQKIQAAIDELI